MHTILHIINHGAEGVEAGFDAVTAAGVDLRSPGFCLHHGIGEAHA